VSGNRIVLSVYGEARRVINIFTPCPVDIRRQLFSKKLFRSVLCVHVHTHYVRIYIYIYRRVFHSNRTFGASAGD